VADVIEKRSSSYFWPAATATMTAATLLLSAMLVWRSPDAIDTPQVTTVVEAAKPQVVATPAVVSTEPSDIWPANWSIWPALGPPTSGYLAVRHAALTQGLAPLEHESFNAGYDGTPSETRARPPATARELLQELLPETTRNGSRS
jgi:hypothetical protein